YFWEWLKYPRTLHPAKHPGLPRILSNVPCRKFGVPLHSWAATLCQSCRSNYRRTAFDRAPYSDPRIEGMTDLLLKIDSGCVQPWVSYPGYSPPYYEKPDGGAHQDSMDAV